MRGERKAPAAVACQALNALAKRCQNPAIVEIGSHHVCGYHKMLIENPRRTLQPIRFADEAGDIMLATFAEVHQAYAVLGEKIQRMWEMVDAAGLTPLAPPVPIVPVPMTSVDEGPPRIYTLLEAAKILRVSKHVAYNLVHSGDLRSIRVGKRFRIPAAALNEMQSAKREDE